MYHNQQLTVATLFIEGNRSEIDKANVVESYNKIKAMGFIPTMPVEFLPIEQAQNKLGGRRLLKPVLKREKGEGICNQLRRPALC